MMRSTLLITLFVVAITCSPVNASFALDARRALLGQAATPTTTGTAPTNVTTPTNQTTTNTTSPSPSPGPKRLPSPSPGAKTTTTTSSPSPSPSPAVTFSTTTTPPSTEGPAETRPTTPPSTEGGVIVFPPSPPRPEVAPPSSETGLDPQQQAAVDIVSGLPGVNDTRIEPAVVVDVTTGLTDTIVTGGNDTQGGAQVLSSSLSSGNAVSVAKGFTNVVIASPSFAASCSQSFAIVVQQAAIAGDVFFLTKCVSSFSVSLVFLVVTGNVAIAKTCVLAFSEVIVTSVGCASYVTIIFNVLFAIIVAVPAATVITF